MFQDMIAIGNGGGISTIKEAYYNKVFKSDLTTNTVVAYGSPARCTIAEGGWVNDETNKAIYVYCDFTINTTQSSSTNYDMVTLSGWTSSMRPRIYNSTSNTRGDATLLTDAESTVPTKNWIVHYFSSDGGITVPSGQGATANDHYIVYGSWNY